MVAKWLEAGVVKPGLVCMKEFYHWFGTWLSSKKFHNESCGFQLSLRVCLNCGGIRASLWETKAILVVKYFMRGFDFTSYFHVFANCG